MGFVFVFLTASIDYHTWSSISGTLYVGMVGVLIALNVIAQAVFGSARWFTTALVNIQPSELAKVIIILVLADFFTRHNQRMVDFRWVLRSLLLTLGIVIWVVLQPNLSTSILLMVLWFALWWASGARLRHIMYFVVGGVLFLAIAIPSLPLLQKMNLIQEYQLKRINNFLKPTGGEEEARYGDQYNIEQALIAIGDGGLTGRGLGQGSQVQLRYLKVRWSDFIFATMAEEFGFIGTVVFMLLVVFVTLRCLRAARIARDTYGGADLLRGCHADRLPGDGQHGRQSQAAACHRAAAAVHQLRGQLAVLAAAGRRAGGVGGGEAQDIGILDCGYLHYTAEDFSPTKCRRT